MKIVINNTYGGFSLSPLAIKEYLKLKGKDAYFYDMKFQNKEIVYTKKDNFTGKELFLNCFTKDFGEKFKTKDIAEKEFRDCLFNEKGIDRTDEDLIKVVESGTASDMKIEGVTIAGKTGTAELKTSAEDTESGTLGWFDCYTIDRQNGNDMLIISMVENLQDNSEGGSHYLIKKIRTLFN